MKNFETGLQFSGRSLYPNLGNAETTAESAKPETAEQAVLASEGQAVPNAGVNKNPMIMWVGILILFVVLFSLNGGKIA